MVNTQTVRSPSESIFSLQGQNLACIRNDLTCFENLNISLNSGELLQVEGPNGSGKTSLLRILCGLSLAAEGRVLWQDHDIQKNRSDYYANMLFIGHSNGVKKNLTCAENLRLGVLHGDAVDTPAILQALADIGLEDLDEEYAGRLSAGQQRRLARARLHLSTAPLWILDEPFTALDYLGREKLEQMFDRHCAEGGMIVLTTHHALNLKNSRIQHLKIGA